MSIFDSNAGCLFLTPMQDVYEKLLSVLWCVCDDMIVNWVLRIELFSLYYVAFSVFLLFSLDYINGFFCQLSERPNDTFARVCFVTEPHEDV